MSPLRYLALAVGSACLRGWRITPRYLGVLAGRALGG